MPLSLDFRISRHRTIRLCLLPATLLVAAALLSGCGGGGVATSEAKPSPLLHLDTTHATTLSIADLEKSRTATGLAPITLPPRCTVTVHRFEYQSVSWHGTPSSASAALLVPGGDCAWNRSVLAHFKGTDTYRARDLSNASESETAMLAIVWAAQGYAVIAPNYLGYANSSYPFHPYLQKTPTAEDGLRAVQAGHDALRRLGVGTNGKLYLSGISQGGHSAVATAELIESTPGAGLQVTASAPISGPYALEETVVQALDQGSDPVGSTIFLSLLMTSYQKAYGDIYSTESSAFQSPYAGRMADLLPGTLGPAELLGTGLLPTRLQGSGGLFTPEFVREVVNDSKSGVRRALRDSSLLSWMPHHPVALCGASGDTVVPFSNTQALQAALSQRGTPAEVIDVQTDPRPVAAGLSAAQLFARTLAALGHANASATQRMMAPHAAAAHVCEVALAQRFTPR